MTCPICQRESSKGFEYCEYHQLAYDSLKAGYEAWKLAYDYMKWKDYLMRIKSLEATGPWVIEVVNRILTAETA